MPSTEVFHRDHRVQNGKLKPQNDLLRYTLHLGDAAALIEVWSSGAGAYVTLGSYRLQAYNGSTYTTLPIQGFALQVVSPEEVIWEERRFDSGGIALVRVLNRIRRGSRIIESQIVAASGLGLTGAQSIGIVGAVAGTWSATPAPDATGVVFTAAAVSQVPGFCYLNSYPNTASVSTTSLYSGAIVAAGTVTRIGILAGFQDAQYAALGSAAAYAGRWAAYNRTRIRQRLVVGVGG